MLDAAILNRLVNKTSQGLLDMEHRKTSHSYPPPGKAAYSKPLERWDTKLGGGGNT